MLQFLLLTSLAECATWAEAVVVVKDCKQAAEQSCTASKIAACMHACNCCSLCGAEAVLSRLRPKTGVAACTCLTNLNAAWLAVNLTFAVSVV